VAYNDTMKNAPESSVGRTFVNPTYLPSFTTRMRLSWWAKGGQAQVRIYDQTNASYFTLNKYDESAATPVTTVTFDRQTNWGYNDGRPDSVWIDSAESGHSGCVDIRIEIKNIYNENMFISAPQFTADKTWKWAQQYIRGGYSTATALGTGIESAGSGTSYGGTIGNLYVEDEFPVTAPDKSVLVDTDDYSRYDRLAIDTSATTTIEEEEFIELTGTTAAQTLTITPPTATSGACLKIIKNRSTQTWTIAATIDGTASPTLTANSAIQILWNGTDWSKVGAFTP